MNFTKAKIYNLTLSSLLLGKEVVEVETDKSNEVRVLNIHWDIALEATLQDLDLDSLSSPVQLELIEELNRGHWKYAYKYPTTCAFLRRIESCVLTDTRNTHIAKRVGIHNGVKAIFTNEYDAVAEIIPNNVPLNALNSMAGIALSKQLASMSAPLLTGKGAKSLRETLLQEYAIAKAEAQETDAAENFNYEADSTRSEFVAARIS